MFILFQVPIADSRSFIRRVTHRVQFPSWVLPNAKPNAEKGKEHFVRSFGGAEKRQTQGGVPEDWAGEEYYCGAEGAIRFKQSLGKKLFGSKERKIHLNCAFRRFFCCDTNKIVSRLEVGFTRAMGWDSLLKCPKENSYLTILDISNIHQIIIDILALPVYIPFHQFPYTQELTEKEFCPLQDVGRFFSKEYLHSTTSHQGLKEGQLEEWWVTQGNPMLLMELEEQDGLNDNSSGFKYEIHLPQEAIEVDIGNSEGIKLWYLRETPRLPSGGTMPIDVWIILYPRSKQKSDPKEKKRRDIRLHLSRLSSERESLRVIASQVLMHRIEIQTGTTETDKLQTYLSESSSRLSKNQYYGIYQGLLLNKLQEADDHIAHRGEYTNLKVVLNDLVRMFKSEENIKGTYKKIRPNCLKNISDFTKKFS